MTSMHTHMCTDHTNIYIHHIHIIIWRRGYKKNLAETRILWQKYKPYLSTLPTPTPREGIYHVPM